MKSAFLMHPLDASYVRRSGHRLANLWGMMPDSIVELIIRPIKPFVLSKFKIKNHDSMIIICPLTSNQMMTLPKKKVIKKLRQACNLAYKEGAGIISLGAFSAIASNHGVDLVGKTKIGLTTGRAYTIYAVMEQVKPYIKKDSIIAIVGVNGAISSSIARFSKNHNIIRIDKKNIEEIYKADIIISASSSIGPIINEKKLKKNALVVDAAKPSDLLRNVKREDVKVIDGGIIKVPGDVNFGINFDCKENKVYACMAEAFILGMAGKEGNYCIGKDISSEMVKEIGEMGNKLGFKVV